MRYCFTFHAFQWSCRPSSLLDLPLCHVIKKEVGLARYRLIVIKCILYYSNNYWRISVYITISFIECCKIAHLQWRRRSHLLYLHYKNWMVDLTIIWLYWLQCKLTFVKKVSILLFSLLMQYCLCTSTTINFIVHQ